MKNVEIKRNKRTLGEESFHGHFKDHLTLFTPSGLSGIKIEVQNQGDGNVLLSFKVPDRWALKWVYAGTLGIYRPISYVADADIKDRI